MNVTLLGTGDATGVPAPLCDCAYCVSSDRRRRPAVLVEADGTRLLLDAGPDLPGQLETAGVRSVDAVCLTHAHGDHAAGLPALHQREKWDPDHLDDADELEPAPASSTPSYPVYLTGTALDHLRERYGEYIDRRLALTEVTEGERLEVGSVTVTPVPVEHHRPTFRTLSFLVDGPEATVLYAPDMRSFVGEPPVREVDLLICEGAAVLGQPVHGPRDELVAAIDGVDAGRVVLVNVNEHIQRAHTDELERRASEAGYELGTDFQQFTP